VTKEHCPEFSWDHIPLYMHIRKNTDFTEDELAAISRCPLITFEKSTGITQYGSTEAGAREAVKAVKALNPKAKVLFYWNVIVWYDLYEANKKLSEIKDWYLRGADGEPYLIRGSQYTYDLRNRAFRDWWLRTCKAEVDNPLVDGVFLDGNIKALYPPFLEQAISPEESAEYRVAYDETMRELREAIGPDKLMHANIIRALFPDTGLGSLRAHFDGSYMECVETVMDDSSYEEYVARGLEAARQAAEEGYLITFHMGPKAVLQNDLKGKKIIVDDSFSGESVDESRQQARFEYCLAMFLVLAGEYSYFNYTPTYAADDTDTWRRWYPEYDKPLGKPNGPANRDGFVFTREFEHASVRLDLAAREGKIDWS
jgi:hypothetical protein